MPAAFDTITALHRLEDAGFSREQAEAIAAGDLEAALVGEPVTRAELEAGLSALKADMLGKIYAIGVGLAVLIVAANGALVAALG